LSEWRVGAIAGVTEASSAVALLCLHLLVDQPERVDMSRNVSKNSEEDVDEEVAAAASNERCGGRRKEDGNKDEENV